MRRGGSRIALAIGLLGLATGAAAADFNITSPDVGTMRGFDSTRSVSPVGGNDAKTLGAQRRNALTYAASIVLSRLSSPVPINIEATFDTRNDSDLSCRRNSATLGYGGPTNYVYGFRDAPQADVLYPLALANALAGRRLADRRTTPDIQLMFNSRLDAGRDSCLQGTRWYYGLDGKPGADQLDFVATAVHEIIHGLGFESLVALTARDDARPGQFPLLPDGARYPDVFSTFIQDLSLDGQPRWPRLSDDQRAASLTHGPDVVWDSATTSNAAYGYLSAGLNQGRVEMFAPSPLVEGSSISHWASTLSPDQIMAPYESPDTSVLSGIGMAACALQDLGWRLAGGARCPDIETPPLAGDVAGGFVADADDWSRGDPDNLSSGDDDNDNDGGGGGGCTLDPQARFDPIWLMLLGLSVGVVLIRRRYRHASRP
ncbi:JDVT-CTERM domain-containing protein [Salinisphaera sp. Q1T1-3]|uniref:JDVT-CTERM domain-containing protein n=1 Tax=Salinisphaera sp. Q1T1-3 TaxID=2321229 RepID=UPI000E72513A|nr:JDVT-CTERM domain-containing protein [Salinisphaera sp. Q1T1-3]RJS92379.1 JDVT-CTERM domain-containing protein [Salinisphaera sp. Q1T1-3]